MTRSSLIGNRQEISLKDDSRGWFLSNYLFLSSYIKATEEFQGPCVKATKEFQELFANLPVLRHGITTAFVSYDLMGRSSGFGIRCELSEFHVFENPNQFCWILYQLLSRQPKGESGFLLTSSKGVNLFFVKLNGGVSMIKAEWQGKEWKLAISDETGYHPALQFSHRWDPEYVEVRVFDRNEQADLK